MADNLKVLGQALPAATTSTPLYTVPAARSTVVSTLTVCNQNAAAGTFRISVRPAGATLAAVHYLYFDAAIGANVTFAATIGLTLAATDVVGVYSSNGSMSFHLYGNEVA